ncbi:hypothetical protein GCM10027418_16900 [Mariniluteicoccus endophyticus]
MPTPSLAAAAPAPVAARPPSRAGRAYLVVGGVIVAVMVAMALLSYVWTPFDPTRVVASDRLQGPSAEHWLGTDKFGRDTFSQVLVGARTTLYVGFVAVGVAATRSARAPPEGAGDERQRPRLSGHRRADAARSACRRSASRRCKG